MKLENGIYRLTSLGDVTVQLGKEETDGMCFTLGGETYVAFVDPDDGYRSYGELASIRALASEVKVINENTFPPILVEVLNESWEHVDGYDNRSGWTISLINPVTKKVILKIGTDTTDAYYPFAICRWYPENITMEIIAATIEKKQEEQKEIEIQEAWFNKELVEAIGEENTDRVYEILRLNDATILFN